MHQPDSDHKIETIIDGEHVSGIVHHGGSSDISVRLEYPSTGLVDGLHVPYFARSVHREGFLVEYGQTAALRILEALYREQKRGSARRKAFARSCGDFEEVGRIRYLSANPGHPARDRTILEKGAINSAVWVQFEDGGPYRHARLFDTSTGEPFLGEAAVIERSVQEYIEGVQGDLVFKLYIKRTRRKLVSDMARAAQQRQAFGITPRQLHLLQNFGRAWRAGDHGLETEEVEGLIERGYLRRAPERAVTERHTLQREVERAHEAVLKFEAAGKEKDAARCLEKVRKLRRRIEAKMLVITASGEAAARQSSFNSD